jgi:hypothetical protein
MRRNMTSFRVFGPDETASNKLTAIYAGGSARRKPGWPNSNPRTPTAATGSRPGRVMEMLSEHTLEGWFEGYVLTGRHGFFSTYEAFVHIIDSMFNQHAKWLEKSKLELRWRAPISSINLLITSLVWRQDHNGFTHQDPGFLDVVTNKSPEVTRIYLPPDANCLLSVTDHCLRSTNYVNVIVADKAEHLQYLNMDEAIRHCTKGIGIWDFASTDDCGRARRRHGLRRRHPHLGVARRRRHPARALPRPEDPLHQRRRSLPPDARARASARPLRPRIRLALHLDKPVIFNFHAYASLIHKLTYRRANHDNIHVRGYKEKGNINTPLELAILNQVDRFNLAIDVIDRVFRVTDGAVTDGAVTDGVALLTGSADGVGHSNGSLQIRSSTGEILVKRADILESQDHALATIAEEIRKHVPAAPVAVGHRVVHGGPHLLTHQPITPQVLRQLRSAVHFAPVHIPQALSLIAASQSLFPSATQFACFDDVFHQTMPEVASHLPLPATLLRRRRPALWFPRPLL